MPSKSSKSICLECQCYATANCTSKNHSIVTVGTGFRPPAKNSKRWKTITKVLKAGLNAGITFGFKHSFTQPIYNGPRGLRVYSKLTQREKEDQVLDNYTKYLQEKTLKQTP